jgi:hypothetical protein
MASPARQNPQSQARRRAGKRLHEAIRDLQVDIRAIAKATGVDLVTLQNLHKFTPHLSTIEKVSEYLEALAREKRAARKRAIASAATDA